MIEHYTPTGRCWTAPPDVAIEELQRQDGVFGFQLRIDGKPYDVYRSLSGAKQAAEHRGCCPEWILEETL